MHPSLYTTRHGSHLLLRLVDLNWGDFVLQGNVQRSLLLSQWEGGREGFVTVTSEQRPGMLLTILQCTGQPPPQGMTQAQMLVVQRLRNPDLKRLDAKSGIQGLWLGIESEQ